MKLSDNLHTASAVSAADFEAGKQWFMNVGVPTLVWASLLSRRQLKTDLSLIR